MIVFPRSVRLNDNITTQDFFYIPKSAKYSNYWYYSVSFHHLSTFTSFKAVNQNFNPEFNKLDRALYKENFNRIRKIPVRYC